MFPLKASAIEGSKGIEHFRDVSYPVLHRTMDGKALNVKGVELFI